MNVTMTARISFLHAADLHLDSPFKGLANIPEHLFKEIVESTLTALDRLVQTAIDKNVDFVLLVGDLFDNETRGLRAQVKLRHAFEQLNRHHIKVYLSYGNHDYIKGNIHHVTYPDNVFIFNDEKIDTFTFRRNNQALANIYGFSYVNRAITTNKSESFKIVDEEVPFHIAMLHGSYQKNTAHDTYAPFLISDLMKEEFDYWALGHIHQREIIKQHPPIVYPGNTQGRHRNEQGEKGCYYVEMTDTEVKMNFYPLQAIQFESVDVNISYATEIHEVEMKIRSIIKSMVKPTPVLITLTLLDKQDRLLNWEKDHTLDELIELLNESFGHETNWKFIYQYKINIPKKRREEVHIAGDYFIGELSRQMDQAVIQPYLSDLYNHRQAKKHLTPINKETEQTIKEDAYDLLMNELLNEGGD
ncbi:metallophosphoesterase family protein [Virgibacillus sp. W0181]|uniref:metallophosphoesterase family protein n=1 Tax=Virgibacillus sp. W0181 TaxID=3391581 RepID=UPI003F455980